MDATVGTLDVDAYPEIAQRYEVTAIPTFLVFRDGKVVERRLGTLKKEDLAKLLTQGGDAKKVNGNKTTGKVQSRSRNVIERDAVVG